MKGDVMRESDVFVVLVRLVGEETARNSYN